MRLRKSLKRVGHLLSARERFPAVKKQKRLRSHCQQKAKARDMTAIVYDHRTHRTCIPFGRSRGSHSCYCPSHLRSVIRSMATFTWPWLNHCCFLVFVVVLYTLGGKAWPFRFDLVKCFKHCQEHVGERFTIVTKWHWGIALCWNCGAFERVSNTETGN